MYNSMNDLKVLHVEKDIVKDLLKLIIHKFRKDSTRARSKGKG